MASGTRAKGQPISVAVGQAARRQGAAERAGGAVVLRLWVTGGHFHCLPVPGTKGQFIVVTGFFSAGRTAAPDGWSYINCYRPTGEPLKHRLRYSKSLLLLSFITGKIQQKAWYLLSI